MAKGIDPKFVHYGIRKDDLAMIEAICEAEGVDFDWLSEDILKAYHAKKVDVIVKRKTSSVMQSKKYANKYDYADTEN